jgi:hypothetical protein
MAAPAVSPESLMMFTTPSECPFKISSPMRNAVTVFARRRLENRHVAARQRWRNFR